MSGYSRPWIFCFLRIHCQIPGVRCPMAGLALKDTEKDCSALNVPTDLLLSIFPHACHPIKTSVSWLIEYCHDRCSPRQSKSLLNHFRTRLPLFLSQAAFLLFKRRQASSLSCVLHKHYRRDVSFHGEGIKALHSPVCLKQTSSSFYWLKKLSLLSESCIPPMSLTNSDALLKKQKQKQSHHNTLFDYYTSTQERSRNQSCIPSN